MTPLVVIRPEPGCSATVAAAKALGLEAHGVPLFEVGPRSWDIPAPEAFDALLVGSANVFRFGGAGLATLAKLPVLAVGETTATAARAAGFTVAATGSTGLQALIDTLGPGKHRLLRLTGEERVPLKLPRGVTMVERVVYASRALPMPEELIALLRARAVVALHSAEAARHLAAQCVSHRIARSGLRLVALSPRIGAAAGEGWSELAAPPLPDDQALLAMARQMCQEPWPAGRDPAPSSAG